MINSMKIAESWILHCHVRWLQFNVTSRIRDYPCIAGRCVEILAKLHAMHLPARISQKGDTQVGTSIVCGGSST